MLYNLLNYTFYLFNKILIFIFLKLYLVDFSNFSMEEVELCIDDPCVQEMKNKKIEPTFQIQNGDIIYDCDPTPAVNHAHLVFLGYEACKHTGYIKINVPDKSNTLSLIVGFLHGKSIIINSSSAFKYSELAKALGIPYINDYATRLFDRFQRSLAV